MNTHDPRGVIHGITRADSTGLSEVDNRQKEEPDRAG
ncbi:hypothetical protein JOD24_000792 [Kroppenstedtia sanguinis]